MEYEDGENGINTLVIGAYEGSPELMAHYIPNFCFDFINIDRNKQKVQHVRRLQIDVRDSIPNVESVLFAHYSKRKLYFEVISNENKNMYLEAAQKARRNKEVYQRPPIFELLFVDFDREKVVLYSLDVENKEHRFRQIDGSPHLILYYHQFLTVYNLDKPEKLPCFTIEAARNFRGKDPYKKTFRLHSPITRFGRVLLPVTTYSEMPGSSWYTLYDLKTQKQITETIELEDGHSGTCKR